MDRKLVVAVPQLTPAQRSAIREAASGNGLAACFFDCAADALSAVRDAEIIFSGFSELAKAAPRLKWLCTPTAGVNPFMAPDAFAASGAILTCSSGAYGVTISEHIIMVTLEILRRQMEYNEIMRAGKWVRGLPVRSICGSRITLLGTGDIGWQTAERLSAFRPARITGINRSGRDPGKPFDCVIAVDRIDEIIPETDILIISLPGTPETHHLLNKRLLDMLPDGAVVVNAGRGSVIDQKALEEQLRVGRLSAALDVFEQEPIPKDDTLWTCPNLLITPHIAGDMTLPYTGERIVALFLENLENYCAGRPLKRQIDFRKGY